MNDSNRSDSRSKTKSEFEGIDLDSPFQTSFFNKSSEHAGKVLLGKAFIQEYGEPGYYGNKLMDTISKINDETKRSVITAIKFMSIEPQQSRINENKFRIMAVQEKVPVWFIILREATKQVVPDLMNSSDRESDKNNVFSISSAA